MFEKLKEYGLYIILGLVALGALAYAYLKVTNTSDGSEFIQNIQNSIIQSNNQSDLIKSSRNVSYEILNSIGTKRLGTYTLDGDKVLYVVSDNYDNIFQNQKISELDNITDGKLKLILFSGSKLDIDGKENVKTVILNKDNSITIGDETITKENLKNISNKFKGYEISAIGIGPIEGKTNSYEFRDKYFSNFDVYEIGNTNKYIVLQQYETINQTDNTIKLALNGNITGTAENTTLGTNLTNVKNTLNSKKSDLNNILSSEYLNGKDSFKDSMNDKISQIQAKINGLNDSNDSTSIENEIEEIKNEIEYEIAKVRPCTTAEERDHNNACQNALVEDDNGIIKAQDFAKTKQTYTIDGEEYYVAKDVNDIKTQVNNGRDYENIILTNVTSLKGLFQNVQGFNGDLSSWDTSNVTSLQEMFKNSKDFGGDISKWNVSKVTNMQNLFSGATSFNADISEWDTSNVITMSAMFSNATSFNADISGWNVSKVQDFGNMFQNATSFNQDLSNWNVSSGRMFGEMFMNATSFNNGGNANMPWNTVNATNMRNMFRGATAFNANVGEFKTGKVTTFEGMFTQAKSFNNGGSDSIKNWDTSSATNMSGMFNTDLVFNQPIGNWNISKVNNLSNMFRDTQSFNQPLNDWNTSSVITLQQTFQNAKAFNQPLNNWDTSKVTNMSYTFNGASKFNQNISNWNTSSVTNNTWFGVSGNNAPTFN